MKHEGGSILALVGLGKGKGGGGDDSGDSDLDDIAQDMLDAVEDGDAKALTLVLKRLVACKGDEADEVEESEES